MINNPNYLPTDVPGLVQDIKSGAILNVDNNKLEEYKKKKKQNAKINDSFERLNKLENKVSDILKALDLILSKVS